MWNATNKTLSFAWDNPRLIPSDFRCHSHWPRSDAQSAIRNLQGFTGGTRSKVSISQSSFLVVGKVWWRHSIILMLTLLYYLYSYIHIYTYLSLHPRDWKLVKWCVLWNYHFSGRATQQCTDHRIIYIGITFIRSARMKHPVKIQSSPVAVLPAWK